MINVCIMYPNTEGSHFDMAYYCAKHIPLVRRLLGPALLNAVVEEGLGGMEPGSRAPYAALGNLYFESLDAFQKAFGPHAAQIVGDIPNYTNTQPTIQISSVKS
jgi:uncharacterized protein (TIGR02118 family)